MPFDIQGARDAGYSDDEIADHLGKANNFDVQGAIDSGYGPDEIIKHLANKQMSVSDKEPTQNKEGFLNTIGSNFTHGLKNVGDIATGNFDLVSTQTTPQTASLGDKLYSGVDNPPTDVIGIGKLIANKISSGEINRGDLEKAFLEKFGGSLPGKAVGAISGLIPSFNVAVAAIENYVKPNVTGENFTPEDFDTLGLVAPALLGGKNAVKAMATDPMLKAPASITAATYPIRHPMKTASAVAEGAIGLGKSIASPIVNKVIGADNVFTKEPGLESQLNSATALEGKRLGEKLGVDFSAGELTGNPNIRIFEDALANSGRFGGKFAEANKVKTDRLVSQFNKTLDQIDTTGGERGAVGDRVVSAYRSAIDNLIETRRSQANEDIKTIKQQFGDDKLVRPDNLRSALENFIGEGNTPIATDAQKAAASQAQKILNNIKDSNLSLTDVQRGLEFFGDAAKTGKGLWKNLETASDRRFANAAKKALEADLDYMADSSNRMAKGRGAQLLIDFRNNYKNSSQKIQDIKDTTIGRVIGNAARDSEGNLVLTPEAIVNKVASMTPTDLSKTINFLDKIDTGAANQMRRHILESSLRNAIEGKGLRGEGTTKDFAKSEFIKNLPDRQKLNALLGDSSAATDIVDIAAAMNRLIDWGAEQKGSQTAQRLDVLSGLTKGVVRTFIKTVTSESLGENLLNPQKRKQTANGARAFKNIASKTSFKAKEAVKNSKAVPSDIAIPFLMQSSQLFEKQENR